MGRPGDEIENISVPLGPSKSSRPKTSRSETAPAGLSPHHAARRPNIHRTLTTRAYVEAVSAHSQQSTEASLYPGQNLENLAVYLKRSLQNPFPPATQEQGDFTVTLYSLYSSKPKQICHITTTEDLSQKVYDFSQEDDAPTGSILFFRGQASPQWLSAIGALYHVDPEFFQRHLDFRSTAGRLNYFPLPSLPSSSDHMTKLRYSTIGHRERKGGVSGSETIDSARWQGVKAMDRYVHHLNQSLQQDTGLGDSIIRAYSVHDETHFSIEQDVSIYVSRTTGGWICLIWLDTGKDLANGPEGPWLKRTDREEKWPSTSFYPTIQHQPQIGLKTHRTSISHGVRPESKFVQSSSLLHLDYGKMLDSALMARDPFYALNELFIFCAYSEVQLLNLMESKLSDETGFALLAKNSTQLSNLLYTQDILEAHAKRLRDNIEIIKARGHFDWPRASEHGMEQKADAAARSLLKDYQDLLFRAEAMSARCQRGMNVVLNNAMIAESKRAITQAIEVTKLTRLAFLYIPLSFTTSFFGMNLKPIAGGSHPMWLWLVVSVPILAISVLALLYDISALCKRTADLILASPRTWRMFAGKGSVLPP